MTAVDAAAATRGYHFEIIIGIQFGFVNVDRALLHSGSWSYLMWSSAFSWSVASLSFKLLSSTSADRRASHSSLKGPFFFSFCPVSCQRRNSRHCVPSPTFWLPLWFCLSWINSSLYPSLNRESWVQLCKHMYNVQVRIKTQRIFKVYIWFSGLSMQLLAEYFALFIMIVVYMISFYCEPIRVCLCYILPLCVISYFEDYMMLKVVPKINK